jgi:hypothetical protein
MDSSTVFILEGNFNLMSYIFMLVTCFMSVSCWIYALIQKMEVIYFSEMSVDFFNRLNSVIFQEI